MTGTPPGEPLLDEAMARVAEKPRSAQDLVNRLGRGTRDELLDRLSARGLVERHDGKVLGLFPHTTWPARDAVVAAQAAITTAVTASVAATAAGS